MNSSLPQSWERFNSQHREIERSVSDQRGSCLGLSAEALYTTSDDLNRIFDDGLISGTFCDLGCGHGLAPLLYGERFPTRKAIGIEFEKARLDFGRGEAQKLHLENVSLIEGDLLSCNIPKADTYFLYFPTGPVLDRILTTLYELGSAFRLVVIESHGDLLPRIELENWLSLLKEIPLSSKRHYPNARIYERTLAQRDKRLFPFTLSYQEKFFVLTDEEWIGETYLMEWQKEEAFDLCYPPRTIHMSSVKKVLSKEELSAELKCCVEIRRRGEVNIKTSKSSFKGHIRKIITKPSFHLELSGGEKVEWSDITSISKGSELCYDSSLLFSF